jgi:hypothetical protein
VKCVYCAEEIQDAASLCRFCGASRTAGGQWTAPQRTSSPTPRKKGAFTIRLAGALFVLSGILSLATVTSDVALLGAMRSGAIALGYNLLFAGLFLAMGLGLIIGQRWGYHLLLAGTLVYSADRLAFVLHKPTRDAYLASSGISKQVEQLIDLNMIDQAVILTALTALACWWGFALYVYLRRDYFA